ncbi:hypothetical protein PINS_up012549 [Pythium insidiosum]|nr:hypothetical protein PINS_up012549 [Pythium insidiosum]
MSSSKSCLAAPWSNDHDAVAALEETLALLDAWNGDIDALPLGDPPAAVPVHRESRPRAVGAAPSQDRSVPVPLQSLHPQPQQQPRRRPSRRDEILFLRSHAVELQQELEAIQQRVAEARARAAQPDYIDFGAVWENLAVHQLHQRAIVEAENARLRSFVDSQAAVARELMDALQVQAQMESVLGEPTHPSPEVAMQQAVSIDEQLQHIVEMYAHTDGVFSAAPFQSGQRLVRNVRVMQQGDGAIAELQFGWVAPFSVPAVADALWFHIIGKSMAKQCYFLENVQQNEEVSLSVFSSRVKADEDASDLYGRIAMRRFIEDDEHIVMIADARVRPVGDQAKLFDACDVAGESWLRVSRCEDVTSRTLTRVQYIRRIRVQQHSYTGSAHLSSARATELAELMLQKLEEDMENHQQLVENTLLSQSVRPPPRFDTISPQPQPTLV